MAQADGVVANGTGAAVRADLNDQLAAVFTNHSGSSEPATTYAYQWWADTTANVLKIRNSANNAWITLRELDGTLLMEDGSASTPGLAFADDTNTGIFSGAADQVGFATGGAERLKLGNGEAVFNDISADTDFRVESNGQTHMLFVDAGNDAVGIGSSAPGDFSSSANDLVVAGGSSTGISIATDSASGNSRIYFADGTSGSADRRGQICYEHTDDIMFFATGASEALRIDSSGRLLVGTSSSYGVASSAEAQIQSGSTAATIHLSLTDWSNVNQGGTLALGASRGGSVGSYTAVQGGDNLGSIRFAGADGTDLQTQGAAITAQVDLTPGSNDMPGRLVFSTTADGASSPTERVRIDSSGNVGIGSTSPTDTGGYGRALDIQSNTGAAIYLRTNDDTSQIAQGASDLTIRTRQAHPIIFNTNNSEAARIDSSGRLLVNTSSSFNDGSTIQLAGSDSHLGLKYTGTTGGNETQIRWFDKRDQANAVIANKLEDDGSGTQAAALVFKTSTSGTLSERMRLTREGFLAIGGTTTVAGAKIGITFAGATQNGIGLQTTFSGNGSDFIRFNNSAGNQCGEVSQTGTTTVSYTTSSDYRLKENVADIADGITRIKQLAPKRFNFIEDGPDKVVDGFLAHEAQTVVPEAVTGTYNEVDDDGNPVYQGIDPSKLVPLLTAALQEAITKIETLETKVAALEAG